MSVTATVPIITTITTITTIYHAYQFDITTPGGKQGYKQLCADMAAQGRTAFTASGDGDSTIIPSLDGQPITLELTHVFNNQWNTAPISGVSDSGLRVFDWYDQADYRGSRRSSIRRGHWLDITPEMVEVRAFTLTCGYCGFQTRDLSALYASTPPVLHPFVTLGFCPRCVDGPHLKGEDLNLLRMMPAGGGIFGGKRSPLTEGEAAVLVPIYTAAQVRGATARGKARIVALRERVVTKAAERISNATIERDGMLWLLDRGVSIDNVIYYDHTGVFSFGWREPVSEGVRSKLLETLVEFPHAYEIKTAGGVTSTRDRTARNAHS